MVMVLPAKTSSASRPSMGAASFEISGATCMTPATGATTGYPPISKCNASQRGIDRRVPVMLKPPISPQGVQPAVAANSGDTTVCPPAVSNAKSPGFPFAVTRTATLRRYGSSASVATGAACASGDCAGVAARTPGVTQQARQDSNKDSMRMARWLRRGDRGLGCAERARGLEPAQYRSSMYLYGYFGSTYPCDFCRFGNFTFSFGRSS